MKCPIDKKDCLEADCQAWLELTVNKNQPDKHQQGKCAITWIPTLLIELRQTIDKGKKENHGSNS